MNTWKTDLISELVGNCIFTYTALVSTVHSMPFYILGHNTHRSNKCSWSTKVCIQKSLLFWDANTLLRNMPNRPQGIPTEEQLQKWNSKISAPKSDEILKNSSKILPGCGVEKGALNNPFSDQRYNTYFSWATQFKSLILFTLTVLLGYRMANNRQGETGINLLLSKTNLFWLHLKNWACYLGWLF